MTRWRAGAALLLAAAVIATHAVPATVAGQSEVTTMEQLLDDAVRSRGADYLRSEAALRAGGAAAAAALLQIHRRDADPLVRLIVGVLQVWAGAQSAEYDAALDWLAQLPRRFERTPLGEPPPVGVANELSERYGARVVELLALRLVKQPTWPRWCTLGVLLYLEQQRRATSTDALLQFAADTGDAEARSLALQALRAVADPAQPAKLQALRQRLAAAGRALPAELEVLQP